MSRSEEIAEFVEDSGGIASAAQIAKAGFPSGSISYALESGAIGKLTRGVYCLPEVFDDRRRPEDHHGHRHDADRHGYGRRHGERGRRRHIYQKLDIHTRQELFNMLGVEAE